MHSVWANVSTGTESIQADIVEDLIEHNRSKFETLENILKHEIQKTRQLQEDFNLPESEHSYIHVNVDDQNLENSDYMELLSPYNARTVETALAL